MKSDVPITWFFQKLYLISQISFLHWIATYFNYRSSVINSPNCITCLSWTAPMVVFHILLLQVPEQILVCPWGRQNHGTLCPNRCTLWKCYVPWWGRTKVLIRCPWDYLWLSAWTNVIIRVLINKREVITWKGFNLTLMVSKWRNADISQAMWVTFRSWKR